MSDDYFAFQHAVDEAVKFLLPCGTCTHDRWLTFEVQLEKDGETFDYLIQYCATTNYITWRTVVDDGIRHVQMDRNSEWREKYLPAEEVEAISGWGPLKGPKNPDMYDRRKFRLVGPDYKHLDREFVYAPGTVITHGHHDSCWRDHALTLRNYDTKFFDEHGCTHRVKRVYIEGPVKWGYWSDAPAWLSEIEDGDWANDTSLRSNWAVYVAMSHLAHCVGRDCVDLVLDVSIDTDPDQPYDEDMERNELRVSLAYRLREGKVVAVGEGSFWSASNWEDCEPFDLTEERVLIDSGIAPEDFEKVKITHLFTRVQNQVAR